MFKTISDQYGKFSMIKVIRGKVTSDMSLFNMTTPATPKKLGRLYTMKGKKAEDKEICCGDIGAIGKMDKVKTGDTLCEPKTYVKLRLWPFYRLLRARHRAQDQAGDREAGHRPEQAERGGSPLLVPTTPRRTRPSSPARATSRLTCCAAS